MCKEVTKAGMKKSERMTKTKSLRCEHDALVGFCWFARRTSDFVIFP